MAHCEHIIVWHISADEYAAVTESYIRTLSKCDKYVVLGPKYLAHLVAPLIDKESSNTEGMIVTSKPSTTNSMGPIVPENKHPAGVQSSPAVVHGSNSACPSQANAISHVAGPKSAKVDKKSSESQCQTCKCADCKVVSIWESSAVEVCGVLCVLVGFLNGCYIIGYYVIMLIRYLAVKECEWMESY